MRTISVLSHVLLLLSVQARIIEIRTANPALRRLHKSYPLISKGLSRVSGLFLKPGTRSRIRSQADDLIKSGKSNLDDLIKSGKKAVEIPKNVGKTIGNRFSKILNNLFRRDIIETKFTGNTANLLYSYLGEFSFGYPAQNLLLLMDTGSSRLWVRGQGQCNANAERCQTYNPRSSRTHALEYSMSPAKRITYGDGSFVEGPWVKDSVKIGDYTARNFIFQHGTNVNDHADEDGIVGLGFSVNTRYQQSPPTLWEALLSKRIPDSPVFSSYIDETETAGAFIFGGVDLARYKGDISWSSVSRSSGVYWGLDVSYIQIGRYIRSWGIPLLVIDTGTSLALFPHDIAKSINTQLNLPKLDIGGPTDSYYGISCPDGKVPQNTNLPKLTIAVENNVLEFSPQDYLFVYPDNQGKLVCVSGILGSDLDHIVIGNLFLRKYYLVFDQWYKKIGFATPNRSANVTNQFQPANSRHWVAGRAALQIEGAWNESRSPSVWDTYLQSGNLNATNFGSVDVTADHYHQYESDLKILKTLDAKLYRFSFSWSRILPDCRGSVNEDAVNHYSKVIDAIIANGAEPVATMHHWDLPESCMKLYNGWASREIVNDFVNYADILFSRFSGKVKYWLTMNEPSNICILAYNSGKFAPNLYLGLDGQYKCGHYSVLATAYTIQLAKNKYPGTVVSYPLVASYGEPLDPSSQRDIEAGIRSMEFTAGWFLDPFFRGDYPSSMRNDARVGPVLPTFTDADKDALSLGIGFLAINYYTSYYIYESSSEPGNYAATSVRNGKTIGPVTGIEWQFTFPQGLDKLLTWIDKRYPSNSIWITELGCAAPKEPELPLHEIVQDDFRIDFLNQHLQVIMNSSVSIYAVLIWSLLDNWEWQYGYSTRFGVTAVDFNNGTLARTIKSSGYWLRDYFAKHITSDPSVSSKSPSAKTSASDPLAPSVLIMMLLIILS